MSYTAFGQRRDPATGTVPASTAAVETDREQTWRGYTGQEQLDAVGLVHMNGRVYDPEIGRFTSADPTNGSGLNRYSYVNNNPMTFTDPSGFGADGPVQHLGTISATKPPCYPHCAQQAKHHPTMGQLASQLFMLRVSLGDTRATRVLENKMRTRAASSARKASGVGADSSEIPLGSTDYYKNAAGKFEITLKGNADGQTTMHLREEVDFHEQAFIFSSNAAGKVVSIDFDAAVREGRMYLGPGGRYILSDGKTIIVLSSSQGFALNAGQITTSYSSHAAPDTRWSGRVKQQFIVATPTQTISIYIHYDLPGKVPLP